jgi:tRNA threonylcarbamoyladenosine biosynthesis protein TsaB
MYRSALEALSAKQFEDVAYFEPFYLKDFITTVSTKNVFGNKPPAP